MRSRCTCGATTRQAPGQRWTAHTTPLTAFSARKKRPDFGKRLGGWPEVRQRRTDTVGAQRSQVRRNRARWTASLLAGVLNGRRSLRDAQQWVLPTVAGLLGPTVVVLESEGAKEDRYGVGLVRCSDAVSEQQARGPRLFLGTDDVECSRARVVGEGTACVWGEANAFVFKVQDYIREMVDVRNDRECGQLYWVGGRIELRVH